ncbi:MAG: holo-ACP synthase [bacterium]
MQILGIGIDIVNVSRIERLLREKGQRFKERVFTDAERRYCDKFKNTAERYAARFAAKEAVRKAISPVYTGYYNYRDIEVIKRTDGMPGIKLHGRLSSIEEQHIVFNLSLTHEHDYAVAVVIMQKQD